MQAITKKARHLRNNMTAAEIKLWNEIRREKLGLKFRRQYPIKIKISGKVHYFIADFYCPHRKLIIEIDGKIHDGQKEYDELRTEVVGSMGYHIIRFSNDEVMCDIDRILEELSNNHSPSPTSGGREEV